MPDMKSELSKVLNQWDKHEETIRNPKENTMPTKYLGNITNNVSRETFNYVRDNPNNGRKQIQAALTKKGFKAGSIDALLTSMTRARLIEKQDDNTYVAREQEYRPLKGRDKPLQKPSAGIAALSTDTAAPARDITKKSIILNHAWTPQKAIENLTVFQARALYDELKKLFGG